MISVKVLFYVYVHHALFWILVNSHMWINVVHILYYTRVSQNTAASVNNNNNNKKQTDKEKFQHLPYGGSLGLFLEFNPTILQIMGKSGKFNLVIEAMRAFY